MIYINCYSKNEKKVNDTNKSMFMLKENNK